MTTNAAKCTIDRKKRKMGHFSSCSLPSLQWNLDITNLYDEVLYIIMNECVQNYLGYKLYQVKNQIYLRKKLPATYIYQQLSDSRSSLCFILILANY